MLNHSCLLGLFHKHQRQLKCTLDAEKFILINFNLLGLESLLMFSSALKFIFSIFVFQLMRNADFYQTLLFLAGFMRNADFYQTQDFLTLLLNLEVRILKFKIHLFFVVVFFTQ